MSDETKRGRVIYDRTGAAESEAPGGAEGARMAEAVRAGWALWPALAPLLVGFALLVALIVGLGAVSITRLETLSEETRTEERRLANVSNNLLNLRLALNRLNTEARLRGRAEGQTRGPLMPPTALPIRRERAEVEKLLAAFDALPLEDPTRKQTIRDNANAFIEVTKEPDSYSLRGFPLYRDVDRELEALSSETVARRLEVEQRRNDALAESASEIRYLMWAAALTGLVVASATFLEAWRRFRQMRRSNEALRRERRFSSQMLGGMPSAVAALDRDGRVRAANQAFYEVFPGFSEGSSIHEASTGTEGRRLLAGAADASVSRTTYRGRWPLTNGAGDASTDEPGVQSQRVFDVYSSPLELDGERGQLLTLVDVTEAAEAERDLRRQEALAAVGKAAAQVAHEIKNPLGSIRLGVALLRDMAAGKDAQTTIDLVERGINHLSKITLDVTQFSRRGKLSLVDTDLNGLLDESLDLVADKIKEKQIEVERRYDADPLEGRWDEDQLRQVFVNLIANAVDAGPQGASITISTDKARVAAGTQGDPSGQRAVEGVRIRVSDNGEGMDEQTRARIFEPFFTTKKKGTGLGLAIARQIVEQHDGTIGVESAPGAGTTITIELPLEAEAV